MFIYCRSGYHNPDAFDAPAVDYDYNCETNVSFCVM